MNYEIDFVVLWVDDSDPIWQAEYKFWKHKILNTDVNLNNKRYRDWGVFRYWFRAVEIYAPWVRKIHLVTCGHYPSWLNPNHPKLHLVKHSDIMSTDCLPTFNSEAIEVNINKIDGLAEHFVYFNDDVYLNSNVTPEFFFNKGLPCDIGICLLSNPDENTHMGKVITNNMEVINTEFSKYKTMIECPYKWLNPIYGRYVLHTLLTMLCPHFLSFTEPHLNFNLLKSSMDELWEKYPEYLQRTSQSRFRDDADVNAWLLRDWNLASNKFYPMNSLENGIVFGSTESEIDRITDVLLFSQKKVVVINDCGNTDQFDIVVQKLNQAFLRKMPNKSSFEI